jgi:signal transduction histidine kinase
MASPVLSRRERGEAANEDTRPDRELREAYRHMHEFLAVLGHELRSPLAAIRNALRVLEQQGEDAVTRERVRSMMERQTQCLDRLVEDMREVSCIEQGKIPLRKQPLDLAQTVSRAVETVRVSVEGRGHQLEISLPPEPVALDADPARLEQVLTNLLNNAAKYMEPGGRIWVTAAVQDGDVVLRVQDSGIGIDPEMLPHVFDPFWQVERTLDHSQGGLGIGLALVRKLVEMHGGRASAYSAGLGRGSEFVVCLPAQAEVLAGRARLARDWDSRSSTTSCEHVPPIGKRCLEP